MTHPTRLPDTTLSVAEAISRISDMDMRQMRVAVHLMIGKPSASSLQDLFDAAMREVAKDMDDD